KATYGEDIKWFWFQISFGLMMLKYEVAKRFGLKGEMIGLKYWDEDNELILICVDDDLEDALVASGSENSMNLICKLSVP
ncbi:NIN-like protein, partial [Tanacetum coccineum]